MSWPRLGHTNKFLFYFNLIVIIVFIIFFMNKLLALLHLIVIVSANLRGTTD